MKRRCGFDSSGRREPLQHFKDFSDREAAAFSTVSSFSLTLSLWHHSIPPTPKRRNEYKY
ncbi:hypothetical protein EYF80_015220 [Liparis tanakae]|uniref:Uncharacterized protein n=1 Tax=Liparis tanakae TaxID=230148 RepID=A0A4Z2IC81_9TELE|nr:hypothetical protein EYF80_015220 [Liparis tanakae]